MAEVVSRGSKDRDYQAKRGDYLVFGIRECWTVDPWRRQVTVLARREGPDGPAWTERTFQGGEIIGSELLPGFGGTVAELRVDAELDDGVEP